MKVLTIYMFVMEKPNESKLKYDPDRVIESHCDPEFMDGLEADIDSLMPKMNIDSTIMESPKEESSIVGDDEILGLYNEILQNCRDDRKGVDEILLNFIDMVINDGDASSASKEAIVNLLKIKSDTSDKMSKVADLMTRIKLKEKDTFPRYLNAQQNNKVVIEGSKREMLKSVNKLIARNKKNEQNK